MRAAQPAPLVLAGPWLAAALVVPGPGEAGAHAQPAPQAATASGPEIDLPELPDMPDIGLDWPDLRQPDAPASPTPAPAAAGQPAETASGTGDQDAPTAPASGEADGALRYAVRIEGLEIAGDERLFERFDALSELRKGEDRPANLAQINRRVRSDAALLEQLLRARGHYDARTRFAVTADAAQRGRLVVSLSATPGRRYPLRAVDVTGLDPAQPGEAALRALFAVEPGDPADADAILAATEALRSGLTGAGYPFAKVEEPELRVDHDTRTADLTLIVENGGFRRFGRIVTTSGDRPFDARHIADIARFRPGEPFDAEKLADLNRAIVATGLVSTVTLTPRDGSEAGAVDIAAAITPAPPRTIAGELGYGTGEGARAEVSWQHRNLLPPEGSLTLRGVAGTNEQSASAIFRRNNFRQRDRALNIELAAANLDQQAYAAQTLGLSASLERTTNLLFQKDWVWSLGAELRVSDERDLYGDDLVPRRRRYVIAAVPTALTYDGSDDLLNPTRGFRLGGRLSPELSLQAGAFGYVRAQIDGSAYWPVQGERLVLGGRLRLGTILGAGRDRIAPTRRFYAGGGGSVRGYSYQAIGPRDLNNDPLGGRSLTELSVEARFRFGRQRQFGIVPFIDAGTISTAPLPALRDLRVGAGLGVRYYSNFGPIRIDVGTPLNPQPGDGRIAVTVSLGQAF